LLRTPLGDTPPLLHGPVARRMLAACWPYRTQYITPMAAVAGSVADEVLAAMCVGRVLDKAYVNNGGDIALYLAEGASLTLGVVNQVDHPAINATAKLVADMPVRGLATSGWRGRSQSLGIADAVTVLAADAATADAAATMIANAVNIEHDAIVRRPARELRARIGRILGIDREWNVGIVGVGHLGSALVSYKEFQRQGFAIRALFDNDQRKIGSNHKGVVIADIKDLPAEIKKRKLTMIIIAVPASVAQTVCDLAVSAGVKAFLNFAQVNLKVPSDVIVRTENMAMELEFLSFHLSNRAGRDRNPG